MKKGIQAAAVFCTAVLLLNGCAAKKSGDAPEKSTSQTDSTVKKETNVKLKSYELPKFLANSQKADVLSNPIYKSFDSAVMMVEPKEQPFDGYKCTACFNDSLYIFVDDEHYGILSSTGDMLLPADGINKITAAAAGLLRVSDDDGTTEYYRTDGDNIYPEKVADFDIERISFERSESMMNDLNEDDPAGYLLYLDGEQIYDTEWISYQKLELSAVDTQKSYEAVFKASTSTASYYIAFDKFYNFTVYESEYGFIRMRLRGEEAECYILDQEHYKDLQTLIGSFGSESRSARISAEDDNDYIQLTLGLPGKDTDTVTISPDGFCFTESADGEKYFSVMDPETFTDLVSWIDGTLSTEYKN